MTKPCVRQLARYGLLFRMACVCIAAFVLSGCATDGSHRDDTPSAYAEGKVAGRTMEMQEMPSLHTESDTDSESAPETAPAVYPSGDGPSRTIRLAEAVRTALDSNLDLALSQALHEVAETGADAASHAFYPTLGAGGGVSRTDGIVQSASSGRFENNNSRGVILGAGLGFSRNIGAQVYDAMAARRIVDAALLDSMAAEQRLILAVIELYENLVLAKVARDVAEQLVQLSREFEHLASVRHEGGIGLGSDAARAQANLAASRQQLEQAENLRRNTSVRLANVLRFDPVVLLDPVDTSIETWQLPPDPEDGLYAESALRRPDIEAARERVGAAQEALRARWWDLLAPELAAEWRLTGVGGDARLPDPETGGTIRQDIGGLERQERYGLWLNWSLSFAKVDRIHEQRAASRVAALDVARLEDRAAAEVRQAQNDIRSAGLLIALSQDEIAAAETNHRLSLARFTAGTAIAIEVLDAQDSLAVARLKLARYTTEMNIAQARLLAAAGTIRADSSVWAALD